MKSLWIFGILFGFLLVISPTFGYTASKFVSDYDDELSKGQKIKVLDQKSDVISVQVIEPSLIAQAEQIKSKIWLITSDEFGCSPKNQDAIEFLQSIAFVYFTLYGVKSEFDTTQCLYITQVENDPDNFLYSIQNYDLPIIIFDSETSSHLFSKENDHHYQIVEYEKPHIVFCYCSIPAKSHTATWELSHQLSHFILELRGEAIEISQDWVHDAESESVNCVNIRRQPGLCSDKWTPVFGNFPMEMMTVKIHPDYFRELGSIDQLLLSQEQNKKIQPELAFRNMIYDLVPNVDVEIVDLKIIPMDDKPKDPFDDSDVIVITFEITNRGIDYFVLSDKMFRILVLNPSFTAGEGKPESSFIIDNYFTLYDAGLETRYDDYPNLEIFEDCDYLRDRIFVNQTKTFSICFDVLRRWNNEVLNIDGPKHYFLTLMDNIQYNSCPNCVENLLSSKMISPDYKKTLLPPKLQELLDENYIVKLPFWIQKTIEWYNQGIVSEKELVNAINFLLEETKPNVHNGEIN